MRTPREAGQREVPKRVGGSVLDRLLADAPPAPDPRPGRDPAGELRVAVHRDLEALLNARRPWRSIPPGCAAAQGSSLSFGVPDFTSGALNHRDDREALRHEIELTIRRHEPRLTQVRVRLRDEPDRLRAVLRFRIEAVLRVEPVVAPIAFDTAVHAATAAVVLQLQGAGA